MSVIEFTSRVTRRSLMNRSKDELASRVLELMNLLDRQRARQEATEARAKVTEDALVGLPPPTGRSSTAGIPTGSPHRNTSSMCRPASHRSGIVSTGCGGPSWPRTGRGVTSDQALEETRDPHPDHRPPACLERGLRRDPRSAGGRRLSRLPDRGPGRAGHDRHRPGAEGAPAAGRPVRRRGSRPTTPITLREMVEAHGRNWEEVVTQIAEERRFFEQLGLTYPGPDILIQRLSDLGKDRRI